MPNRKKAQERKLSLNVTSAFTGAT